MEGTGLLELLVEGPGTGAFFLARDPAGRTFRLHGGLPGELVLARPRTGDAGFADMVAVRRPSPDRIPSPCPHSRRCGGCGWIELAPAAQLRLRLALLREALAARGLSPGEDLPRIEAIAAPASLGFRWRIRLQADLRGRPPAIGFHRPGSRKVLDVPCCPLAAPPLAAVLPPLREALLAEAPPDLTGLELAAVPGGPGALLFLNPRDRAPATWPALGERLLARVPGLAGVAVRPPGRRAPLPAGAPDLLGARHVLGVLPSGAPVAAAPRGFLQGNLPAADLLADLVAGLAAPVPGARVLDLHAGAGLLSWRLAARGGDVLAVEIDPLSAAAARALPAPPRGRLAVRAGDAGTVAGAFREAAAVVADPPRSGLGPLAGRLVDGGPPRLVLVSCSVGSLARDLAALAAGGYRVRRLVAVDLFPHTRHLETVALLERRDRETPQSW